MSPSSCFLYLRLLLVLRSIMDIQIVLYQVEGYADQINLPLELTVNALFFAFWLLLSNGHKLCYTEFNSEKAIYHNRLLRTKKEFLFENARAVFSTNAASASSRAKRTHPTSARRSFSSRSFVTAK